MNDDDMEIIKKNTGKIDTKYTTEGHKIFAVEMYMHRLLGSDVMHLSAFIAAYALASKDTVDEALAYNTEIYETVIKMIGEVDKELISGKTGKESKIN